MFKKLYAFNVLLRFVPFSRQKSVILRQFRGSTILQQSEWAHSDGSVLTLLINIYQQFEYMHRGIKSHPGNLILLYRRSYHKLFVQK